MSSPASRGRILATVLALVAVTFLAYAGVRANGFVEIDDDVYVTENARVRAGLTVDGAAWALTSDHAANWHPLTWLSHMLDVELFGLDAGAHHLVSVGLHALAAALLFLFLNGTTRAFWTSAAAAAFFALHPLRVESVAWASERKDVLAGVFWMLALLAWTRYSRAPALGRYLVVLAVFALGLAAKPMGITLPFVLLLVDRWPLGRWRGDDQGAEGGASGGDARFPPRRLTRLVLEKLPLLALCIASAWITLASQTSGGALDVHGAIPAGARVANALQAVWFYVGKTLWPTGLAVFYPHPALVDPERSAFGAAPLAALAGLVGLLGLAWSARRRRPWVTVGILWMLGTLVPVLGLVQVGEQAWADRYAYLPTVGLYLAVLWSVRAALVGRSAVTALRPVAATTTLALLAACAVLTRGQVRRWHDGRALFEHAIAVTERNWAARNHLAFVLERRGEREAAIEELREALRVRPLWADGHGNLGAMLRRAGRPEEAEVSLRRALALEPEHATALGNLGVLLEELGRSQEALESFRHATRAAPDRADAWVNLGTYHLRHGEAARAAAAFESALELAPLDAPVHAALGRARARLGQWSAAVAALRRAVTLGAGDDPAVLEALAAAHAELGEIERAVEVQTRALALVPERGRAAAEARLARYRSLADG